MLCPSQHISRDALSLIAQRGNQSEINIHFMLELDRPVPKAAGNFIRVFVLLS